jgi:hypothetical protein
MVSMDRGLALEIHFHVETKNCGDGIEQAAARRNLHCVHAMPDHRPHNGQLA